MRKIRKILMLTLSFILTFCMGVSFLGENAAKAATVITESMEGHRERPVP